MPARYRIGWLVLCLSLPLVGLLSPAQAQAPRIRDTAPRKPERVAEPAVPPAVPPPVQPAAEAPLPPDSRVAGRVQEAPQEPLTGRSPLELPKIPTPDARAAVVPTGFRAELVASNLVYPSSIEFDDQGNLLVAEAGYSYGDEVAPARVLRLTPTLQGMRREIIADQLNGPVNDILWHNGRLFISHRGKISVSDAPGQVRDLVTGLPSLGDHQNNAMAVGPDGRIYFGQGTATNSGVVGVDNFKFGWLQKYPEFHDVPARDVVLNGQVFETPDPLALLNQQQFQTVATSAFQPFGVTADADSIAPGGRLPNGTILRMNPDGSNLEVFAWGLRNPFGLGFDQQGTLLVTDAGYDDRGSRPVANAPDVLWQVRQGGWYGFPDYAAGLPITDQQFRSAKGPPLSFLMAKHPPVEKPLATLPPHTGGMKFDMSPGGAFGTGQIYIALLGDLSPETGAAPGHPGFSVSRIDTRTMEVVHFFRARRDALGPRGFEYVATAGPKRPVDVKFSPDGRSLYVVDFGAIAVIPTAIGATPQPVPGSGAVWRISSGPPLTAAQPQPQPIRREVFRPVSPPQQRVTRSPEPPRIRRQTTYYPPQSACTPWYEVPQRYDCR